MIWYNKVNKIIVFSLFCFFAMSITFNSPLLAAVVYLHDGQIHNGKILEENEDIIKIKTKYQTKEIPKKYVERIVYTESVLEPVRIVTTDNDLIEGFLVYQDVEKAVYKKNKSSTDELSIPKNRIKSLTLGKLHSEYVNILTNDKKIVRGAMVYQDAKKIIVSDDDSGENKQTILRDDIKRITYEEIIIFDSEVVFSPGLGMPFNTGGADLGLAPAIFVGYISNFSYIRNTKLMFEAGYSKFSNASDENVSLQVIPASVSLMYSFHFKHVDVLPEAGLGASVMYYRDSDGDTFLGTKPMFVLGTCVSYKISGYPFILRSFLNYNIILDSGKVMGNLFLTIGAGYSL